MTHHCTRCGLNKPTADFYSYMTYRCKECASTKWGGYKDEETKAYQNRYREKNKEKLKEYYRDWYSKNGRKRDPVKQRAHNLVWSAIHKGEMVKPAVCTTCPRKTRLEAHHPDYAKPLEVIWYCNRCHRKLHVGSSKIVT